MKYYVVVVRDRASDCYGVPSFVLTLGGAIRGFADEINRPDDTNMFYKHPDDFDLYSLGTFDDATAVFESETARQIAVGRDLVKTPPPSPQASLPFGSRSLS